MWEDCVFIVYWEENTLDEKTDGRVRLKNHDSVYETVSIKHHVVWTKMEENWNMLTPSRA